MEPLLQENEVAPKAAGLSNQAVSFFAQTALALGSWLGLMALGYVLNPQGISQAVILVLSAGVPLIAGFFINAKRQNEMATAVWLVGLVWMLIVCLWILDMPTAPMPAFNATRRKSWREHSSASPLRAGSSTTTARFWAHGPPPL